MTERKIIYDENPESKPPTPEDIAVAVNAKIGTLLKQVVLSPTVELKGKVIEQISRLRRKCQEVLNGFNN